MTLTDKDAQRRPWCMFGDGDIGRDSTDVGRLVYVEDGHEYPYQDVFGVRWRHCRECTPEELAEHGLTQPPRPWAERVTQWAIDRNIIGGTTTKDQFGKLVEEVKELRDAIEDGDLPGIIDGIGDASVVLTIIAAQCGLSREQCEEAAWGEIKDRTGKLVNGVFVKEVSE